MLGALELKAKVERGEDIRSERMKADSEIRSLRKMMMAGRSCRRGSERERVEWAGQRAARSEEGYLGEQCKDRGTAMEKEPDRKPEKEMGAKRRSGERGREFN